jgi:hypothetical protein
MDITFRTLGPWGPGKGSNLQPSEVDNNFWSLGEAIANLQNNPALPNGIASIAVSGTQMTITLNDGVVMGPFTLPVLVFRWRYEWTPNTSYAALDVFTVENAGIFLVQIAHTSGDTFDPVLQVPAGSGLAALLQLFGSADATLSSLPDVQINNLGEGDFIHWVDADQKWENVSLGDMAFQNSFDVSIAGGTITGMQDPIYAGDVATKRYVDGSVAGGTTIASGTLMANATMFSGPAVATTLSDIFDTALGSAVVGQIIYRSGTGWVSLPPGSDGMVLRSNGAGLDIVWETLPIEGVGSISAGTGILLSPDPLIATGTVGLATIPDGDFLTNITGTTNPPAPSTLTQFLDHVASNARGSVLTRNISGWIALAPGTNGYYLKTQGAGADATWDAPVGSGTVTSVSAGTGISTGGSPITAAGTVSLAAIADKTMLANTSGSSAAPISTTLSLFWDSVLGTTQGAVLYRGASTWTLLAPGTSGQFLATGGASANPSWQNAPITGSATPNNRIVSNISGSLAVPTGNTLTQIFDAILSSSRGAIIYRTSAGWTALAPGTAGQVLQTAGTGADPAWAGVATNLDGLTDVTVTSPQAFDTLVYGVTAGTWTNQRRLYNVSAYTPGVMSASQNLLFHRFSKGATIPANFGNYLGHASEASGSIAPTNSTTITLARAPSGSPTAFTNVGSLTFAAGSLNPTWSTQAVIAFAAGDILRVRGPATPDPSFADFHMTLVAQET